VEQRFREFLPDPDGQKLITRMDRCGIDVSITCVMDNLADPRNSDERLMGTNRVCAELAKNSNGRLIALAGIDPRRKEAPDMLRECIQEYGMKGLKWHPDQGYYPNSPEAYAMLKVAEELQVPLLTHTGPLPTGAALGPAMRAKYAQPALLDEVAQDFPKLKIIAAHMGNHFAWREWVAVARCRPNVYGDLALWQLLAVGNYGRFCRDLREILDVAGSDSVLFGSDDPYVTLVVPNEQFIQILKDLPHNAPGGIKFTEDEVEAILGGNAKKVFGLWD
jgi:predicted TIM-barrel fold metal-dependent hydrolase